MSVWLKCCAFCTVVGLVFLANLGLASSEPIAPVSQGGRTVQSTGQIIFDISAQPLASALEVYSIRTGLEVVYNGKLAVDRQSTSVEGAFTPELALRMLLEGTGLSPRYMAADAFVLVEDAQRNPARNTAPPIVVTRYYGRIQNSLKHAFCANRLTEPKKYRVAVSFWIGASGAVSRAELLGTTGSADLDAIIEKMVRGLLIGPPPSDFAQPVTLVVAPQSSGTTRDCQVTGMPPEKANP